MDEALTKKFLEFANTVRTALGHPTTAQVVEGVKGQSHSCVLANTFNCGLEVCYGEYGCDNDQAFLTVYSYDEAKKLAEALNSKILIDSDYTDDYSWNIEDVADDVDVEALDEYHVPIPDPEVAAIPVRFDDGEFPEWEEAPEPFYVGD